MRTTTSIAHLLEPSHPHSPPPYFPSLANSKLQVILKVAETVLAPGESYPGGSWHVEGMENEAIVCTGIYYQSVENLSESRLRFRTKVDEYYKYEQVGGAYTLHEHNQIVRMSDNGLWISMNETISDEGRSRD